jgi:hypothetical protein
MSTGFEIEDKIIEFSQFLQTLYLERGQLYGGLITTMIQAEMREVELDFDTFKHMREKYYIMFLPSDEKDKVLIRLMEKDDEGS